VSGEKEGKRNQDTFQISSLSKLVDNSASRDQGWAYRSRSKFGEETLNIVLDFSSLKCLWDNFKIYFLCKGYYKIYIQSHLFLASPIPILY